MIQGPICFIVGAGDLDADRFAPSEGDLIIAADGGYAHLERLGVVPHILLGDFDSLPRIPDHPCIIRHPVIKDDTDMLLAVKTGLERGFRTFFLFGGTGWRLDHTLANLQTLSYLAEHGARGFLLGDGRTVTALKEGSLCFDASCRGFLSVFCLGDRADGVSLCGLKYVLDGGSLTCHMPLGVSNEFLGVPASVSVERGTLLVLWSGSPYQLLACP